MNELKSILWALWEPLRRLIKGEEPAIVTAALGIATNLAAHYGFTLSPAEITWLNVIIAAAIGWAIRQQVVPQNKLPTSLSRLIQVYYEHRDVVDKLFEEKVLNTLPGAEVRGTTYSPPSQPAMIVTMSDATVKDEPPPKKKAPARRRKVADSGR